MIKLNRPPEPPKLNRNKEKLTEKFYANPNETVWKKRYIVRPLYISTYKKCAYCRRTIIWNENKNNVDTKDRNNFLEIDHWYPKSPHKDKVVDWDNLIPSCRICNNAKRDHDVDSNPILNPYLDNPQNYFVIDGNLLQPKINTGLAISEIRKALMTIAALEFEIHINKVIIECHKGIQELLAKVISFLNYTQFDQIKSNAGLRNTIVNTLVELLRHGQPEAEYGSFYASIILECKTYISIKEKLEENKLWDEPLQKLQEQLKSIAYD